MGYVVGLLLGMAGLATTVDRNPLWRAIDSAVDGWSAVQAADVRRCYRDYVAATRDDDVPADLFVDVQFEAPGFATRLLLFGEPFACAPMVDCLRDALLGPAGPWFYGLPELALAGAYEAGLDFSVAPRDFTNCAGCMRLASKWVPQLDLCAARALEKSSTGCIRRCFARAPRRDRPRGAPRTLSATIIVDPPGTVARMWITTPEYACGNPIGECARRCVVGPRRSVLRRQEGWAYLAWALYGPKSELVLVPNPGWCEGSQDLGRERLCIRANPHGDCYGRQECRADGEWSDCSAPAARPGRAGGRGTCEEEADDRARRRDDQGR